MCNTYHRSSNKRPTNTTIWIWCVHLFDRIQNLFALNPWNAAIDWWPNNLSMRMQWCWHFCRHQSQSYLRWYFHRCRSGVNQTMANSLLRSLCHRTLLSVHSLWYLVRACVRLYAWFDSLLYFFRLLFIGRGIVYLHLLFVPFSSTHTMCSKQFWDFALLRDYFHLWRTPHIIFFSILNTTAELSHI